MPNRQHRLNQGEEAEYRRCLQEMQAEGIDVGDLDPAPEHTSPLDIIVVGGLASFIFNLPSGLAGYAIRVRLVARKSGLIMPDCEIATKFDDQIEPESFDQRLPLCTLGQCRYPTAEVLNDRFPLTFHRRGCMIEAMILATGLEPIPKEYLQGMTVPSRLTFWDQFGNEIGIEAELYVDRSTKPRPKWVRPKNSLRGPAGITEMNEPVFRPNLNPGAMPNPAGELLNNPGRQEGS